MSAIGINEFLWLLALLFMILNAVGKLPAWPAILCLLLERGLELFL